MLATKTGSRASTSAIKMFATYHMPTRGEPESSYRFVMRCSTVSEALVTFGVLVNLLRALVADTAGKDKVQDS